MSKEIEAPLKNVWQSVLDLLHPETKPKKVEKQHDLQQRCVVQEERERVDSFFQALQLERAGFKPAAASQADEERERRTRENKMMIAGEDRQVVIEDPLKNVWHSVLDLLHIETTSCEGGFISCRFAVGASGLKTRCCIAGRRGT
jgi:hypothetical protein